MIPQIATKAVNAAVRAALKGAEVVQLTSDGEEIEATLKGADGKVYLLKLASLVEAEEPEVVTDRTPPPETEPRKKPEPFRVARSLAEVPAELRESPAAADGEIQAHFEPRAASSGSMPALAVVPDNPVSPSTEGARRLIATILRHRDRYPAQAVVMLEALQQLEHPPDSLRDLELAIGSARGGNVGPLREMLDARRATTSAATS